MAIEVKTVSGKEFRRAGMKFSEKPIIVDDEKLRQRLTGKSYPPGATVESVLLADAALVCTPVR